MKRSEAIELIEDVLFEEDEVNRFTVGEKIIKKLEDAGMLPPRTILKPLNVEDNAWDPE